MLALNIKAEKEYEEGDTIKEEKAHPSLARNSAMPDHQIDGAIGESLGLGNETLN